jgi:hypothetical protein
MYRLRLLFAGLRQADSQKTQLDDGRYPHYVFRRPFIRVRGQSLSGLQSGTLRTSLSNRCLQPAQGRGCTREKETLHPLR